MELFTATGKLKKVFFFLTTVDVWCVHHGWHGTHRYDIPSSCPTHTRVNMGASIFFTAAMIRAFRSARSRGNGGTNTFAYFARSTRCTVTTGLLVWYSNTQNDFCPGAAIFAVHTLASPSSRNVNYDEKQLTEIFFFFSSSFYLNRFRKYVSYGFPILNFFIPLVHYETSCILRISTGKPIILIQFLSRFCTFQ